MFVSGKLKLAMGTPGGEAIGQTQFQCIMNVLDFGLTVQEAIETPRFRLAASPNFYKPGNAVSMSLETRVRNVEFLLKDHEMLLQNHDFLLRNDDFVIQT